ncbi:MAG: TIGR02147 family protein [Fibrobacterales bacterium]
MATVSIYNYLNYRDYLRDYYNLNKRVNKKFSYRYFLHKAGIQSPVFYQQIIQGKRNLTQSTREKFLQVMKLGRDEATYFKYLIEFNQGKTSSDKQKAYQQLLKMGHFVDPTILGKDFYAFYKQWYNESIRELICILPFTSYSALAKTLTPHITPKQAENSVALLLKLGLIEQNGTQFTLVDEIIRSGPDVHSMSIRAHNKKMLELGAQSIDRDGTHIRNISGITMGVSREAYEKINEELEYLYQKISGIIDSDTNPDRLYHLNTTLFPLSQTIKPTEQGDT